MERNSFWIFLGIGLAVGLCLEVIKTPTHKSKVRLAGFTRFETILDEGREVYVPEQTSESKAKSKSGPKHEEVIVPHQLTAEEMPHAPSQPAPQPAILVPPQPKPETPEQKKQRENAARIAKLKEDEAKKQAEQKAQQDAEKARLEQERLAREEKEKQEAEETEKKNAAEAQTNTQEPPMGAPYDPPDAPPGVAPNKSMSAAEWEAYIAKSKDVSRTQKLVKAYRDGDVSPTAFYSIVRGMLKNPKSEFHQYALVALNSTPSQTSFGLLVSVAHTDANPSVRTQAVAYVDSYAQLGNLRFLADVVSNERDPAILQEALRVIKASATQNLSGASPAQQPSAQGGGQHVTAQALAGYFHPVVTALTAASQHHTDANIRTQAAQILAEIQQHLPQLNQGQGH